MSPLRCLLHKGSNDQTKWFLVYGKERVWLCIWVRQNRIPWVLKEYFNIRMDFSAGSEGKESACNAGDLGSVTGLGGSPGKRNGNPLQYSFLENPMDGGAWQFTIHGVAESDVTEWLHFNIRIKKFCVCHILQKCNYRSIHLSFRFCNFKFQSKNITQSYLSFFLLQRYVSFDVTKWRLLRQLLKIKGL